MGEVFQQPTLAPVQIPDACLRGPVEVPPPVVREKYPDQAKETAKFWQALAQDGRQTRILERGALDLANERLTACKAGLPSEPVATAEVVP